MNRYKSNKKETGKLHSIFTTILREMIFSIYGAIVSLAISGTLVYAVPTPTTTSGFTPYDNSGTKTYLPQVSPVFPSMAPATDVVTSYNPGPYNISKALPTYQLTGYPPVWETPDATHPEVLAAAAKIDWSLVPNAPVRKQNKAGDFVPNTDGPTDPYCWWSDTNCLHPKINLPADFYECPRAGDWGLGYDDGPFNLYTGKYAALENPYAEPALYNFLAEHNNQKANLFVSQSPKKKLHSFVILKLLSIVHWLKHCFLSCCC